MKLSRNRLYHIAVFLLLWYCYLNGLRKFFIPFSSVTVPLLLLTVLALTVVSAKGKIKLNGTDALFCWAWLLIALMVLINNSSLKDSLVTGGVIQLYVLISFLLFSYKSERNWISAWISLTRFYSLIHAVATVIFFVSKPLFDQFANTMFSGDQLVNVLRNYRMGRMTGLSGHFSTNGMILSIGLIFWFEYFLSIVRTRARGNKGKQYRVFLAIMIVFYALILSSKRGPLLFVVFAIIVTNILYQRKNVAKRLFVLFGVSILMVLSYVLLESYIPGLSNIVDKFEMLEDSDAGILNGRMGLWRRALELFRSNPLLGNGYGSYREYANLTDAITTSAHNYYLQILAEFGIVGIVLYSLAFGSAILFCYKTMICSSKNDVMMYIDYERTMACKIAFAVQLFVLLYNLSATALMYYYISIPYFIACSVPRVIYRGKVL